VAGSDEAEDPGNTRLAGGPELILDFSNFN